MYYCERYKCMNEVIQAENNWVVFDLTVTNSLKVN